MSVDKGISLLTIKGEIIACENDAKRYAWVFSEINEDSQSFTVKMQSSKTDDTHNGQYIVEVTFDNYREIPLFLEFIDSITGAKGVKTAYPKCTDSFFHDFPCICNPASRKSYKSFHNDAPHGDWTYSDWVTNLQTGSLRNLQAILRAIYFRITNPEIYVGRMV